MNRLHVLLYCRDEQIDGDTNRQMEIQIDRQRYKQIDGDTN